jgi:predicted DCC family thiol-disulfide oxidoreductase YuxK
MASREEERPETGREAVEVYFDGWCSVCARSARSLARLDLTGACAFRSFRAGVPALEGAPEPAMFERRIQVYERSSRTWAEGFSGLLLVSRHIVLLRPLRPFLALCGRLGLGDRVYDWFASRRSVHAGRT